MTIPLFIPVALVAALGIAANALMTKVLLRYRVCSSSLVGWLSGAGSGACALAVAAALRVSFPVAAWRPLAGLAAFTVIALLSLATALQEADVSTVVPVMGIKIPITALLATQFLGEEHSAAVYVATVLAACAVGLFGLGKPNRSQGGRGRRHAFGISMAVVASASYAVADQFAKVAIDRYDPLTVILWLWIVVGVFCVGMALRKPYRQYRIGPLNGALFVGNGALVLIAIGCLFWSFRLADGVTLPNILFSTRGFFALVAGIVLNRFLPIPFEKQPAGVYGFRVLGTVLLFASVVLAILFE